MVAKVLRLQCLYEMEDVDLLENELETARKFAERNQEVGESYAKKLGQFVHILRQIHFGRSRKSVPAELIDSIKETHSVWFSE